MIGPLLSILAVNSEAEGPETKHAHSERTGFPLASCPV